MSALLLLASPAAAQEEDEEPEFKNANVARAIAFVIPGGGHIYANAHHIGVPLLVGAAAAIGTGYAVEATRACYLTTPGGTKESVPCTDKNGPAIRNGYLVAAVFWAISFWDAPRAAERWNARLGTELAKRGARARPYMADANGSLRLGVSLSRLR